MPLSLRRGKVTAIVEEHEGLVRLEVDGAPCVAYPGLTGPVEVDDEVLVNVQARELELGSGGFDVLHANLTRGLDLAAAEGAHVMKLPYTSLQAAVVHAEESGSLADDLGGMPVVCCSLHSQVAPACAGLGGELRVAYVQAPGGALPLPLSDAVRALRGARADHDDDLRRGLLRRRRGERRRRVGPRLGGRRGPRRGRVRDRPGDRRNRVAARARRARRCRSGERGGGARRLARPGRAGLERRRARAAPRRLAPHAERARALHRRFHRRVAGRTGRAGLGGAA